MARIHSLTIVCPIFPRALHYCFDKPGLALSAIGVGPYDQHQVNIIARNLPLREYLKRVSGSFDAFPDVAEGVKIYADTEYGTHLAWSNDAPSRVPKRRACQSAGHYQLN